jgi:hypothetical protein
VFGAPQAVALAYGERRVSARLRDNDAGASRENVRRWNPA